MARASRWPLLLLLLAALLGCEAAKGRRKKKESKPSEKKPDFKLSSSSFAHGGEFPTDNRADEDNVNPALSWSGAPKNTESFVLIVDSEGPETGSNGRKTHWIVYDIPKEVDQIRDELSGADASDVGRLGFKEDAGQAPVVVDPMGAIDGWVDPEIERMQQMIHGALDASFKEENRAKEGVVSHRYSCRRTLMEFRLAQRKSLLCTCPIVGTTSFGGTRYHGPSIDGTMCIFKLYALSTRLQLPSGASREEIMKAMKGKVLGARLAMFLGIEWHWLGYHHYSLCPCTFASGKTTLSAKVA
eukprot:scaffold222883_cov33-Tisochrysis_lutea.AAC.3